MKRCKKFVALLVVAVLLIQSSLALAASVDAQIMEAQTQRSIELLNGNRSTYSLQSDFQGIMKSYSGGYAIETKLPDKSTSIYQPVGRLDINLADSTAVSAALLRNDLTPAVKAQIEETSEAVITENKSDVSMVVFSPLLLTNSRENIYYTYNGQEMMSDRTYILNHDTGHERISSGKTAATVADALFDLAVSGVATVVPALQLAETGISALKMFLDIVQADTVVVNVEDYVEVLINYNLTTQYTYTNLLGTWHLGLTTHQAYVTTTECREKFYVTKGNTTTGRVESFTNSHNKTLTSIDYISPWATANAFIGNPLVFNITITAGSKKIVL